MPRFWIRLEGADNAGFSVNLESVEIPILGIHPTYTAITRSKTTLNDESISTTKFRDSFEIILEPDSTNEESKYNSDDLLQLRKVLQKPFLKLRRCTDYGGSKLAPPRWQDGVNFPRVYNLLPALVCNPDFSIEQSWEAGMERATLKLERTTVNSAVI